MESDIVVLTSSICARARLKQEKKGKRQKSCFLRGYKKVFHLSSLFFFWCFSTIVLGNEAGEYDKATEVTRTNLIKEESDLIHLWESVRFPQLSSTFISQVVTSSPFWPAIARTQSYATSQMHPEERRRYYRLITYTTLLLLAALTHVKLRLRALLRRPHINANVLLLQ